jgi:hypothetical protein
VQLIIGGRNYDYLKSRIKNRSKDNHYSVKLIHKERKVPSTPKNPENLAEITLIRQIFHILSVPTTRFLSPILIDQLNALFKMGGKMRDKATVKFLDSLKGKKWPHYTDGEHTLFRDENFRLEMETVSYKCFNYVDYHVNPAH